MAFLRILTSWSISYTVLLHSISQGFESNEEVELTPRLAPVWAGVSPGTKLGGASFGVSSAASLSGALVATSGSAMVMVLYVLSR
jgi:hypothetical protein